MSSAAPPPRRRFLVPVGLVVGVIVAGVVLAAVAAPWGGPPRRDAGAAESHGIITSSPGPAEPTPFPSPTPTPPEGGTELYGYLPYWQMSATMADYLQNVPVSTLALFSVGARTNGALDSKALGYRRISGSIGRRLISEAHGRSERVDLVFTSFGEARNGVLFGRLPPSVLSAKPTPGPTDGLPPVDATLPPGSDATAPSSPAESPGVGPTPNPGPPPWHRTVDELVALASKLGVDGVNVDVELLANADVPAYTEFLATLRARLRASNPKAEVSAATAAGERGVTDAVAASQAGVDRIFLMGYDYHWSGSAPGGVAPVDRLDGLHTLRRSIEAYVEAGVPRDRILLGLPLYGLTWTTAEPSRTAPVLGPGVSWFPKDHLTLLRERAFVPGHDPVELSEYYLITKDRTWLLTYFDSPATLRPKLALARDAGFAGAGFWALGYERGAPGYVALMADFRAGKVSRTEAPPLSVGPP